jgi:hypothetical protein
MLPCKSLFSSENHPSHYPSKKLFSPIQSCNRAGEGTSLLLSPGGAANKSSEKLMDRFIPCRMGENLQAKFEAVSQNQEEEYKYNALNLGESDSLAN